MNREVVRIGRPRVTIAAIQIACAALAIYVAVLSLRFSIAPGWRDQRWFALAAVSAAAYSGLDISTTVGASDTVVVWCVRGDMLVAGVHAFAWIRYSDEYLGARRGPLRALHWIPIVIGLITLVPGTVYSGEVRTHGFAPLGLAYRDPVPTPFGEALFALMLCAFVLLALRYALAWRRGVPHAGLHLFAFAILIVMILNDVLVSAGVLSTPNLADLGFILPIGAVAYSLTARFTSDARDLAELRGHLERQVEERTRALARAQEQLHRSEKLAALGQLAAGVAHEVNNPAAAAVANLRYLLDDRGKEGAWPEDAGECLAECLASIQRITSIAGQLLDAGRLAAAPVPAEPVFLAQVVRESVRTARARLGDRVPLAVEVDERLVVVAHGSLLAQVLVNLVVNGAQAIPEEQRDGLVTVRGERIGGRVRLLVEDNGAGMAPEVLRRVFEPFFTTKPFGSGTGLGLAISRGLMQSLGGDLRLESVLARGTRAVVELADAPGAQAAAPADARSTTGGPTRHAQLVDAPDAPGVPRLGRHVTGV